MRPALKTARPAFRLSPQHPRLPSPGLNTITGLINGNDALHKPVLNRYRSANVIGRVLVAKLSRSFVEASRVTHVIWSLAFTDMR